VKKEWNYIFSPQFAFMGWRGTTLHFLQKKFNRGGKQERNGQGCYLLTNKLYYPTQKTTLQKAAYKLNPNVTEHGWIISVEKTKLMVFKGREPVGSKIVIDNKIIEQVNYCNYLGNLYIMKRNWILITKLNKYLKITGVKNSTLNPQIIFKKTRIKLYSVLALPVLLHSSEKWTIKARKAEK
jgi:hypothetical protein